MGSPSRERLAQILSVRDESTSRIDLYRPRIGWFQAQLKAWYAVHGRALPWRRPGSTQYESIVAELLLWRTRAENVAKLYSDFLIKFPDWNALAEAREEELRHFLGPLGYIGRAGTLIELARELIRRRDLELGRDQLQALPGIGQYITSVLLTAWAGGREPFLDVNMARVLERFFGPRNLADIRFDPYLQQLSRIVLPAEGVKEFNWAVLDLGALVCRSQRPTCIECPLKSECTFAQDSLPSTQG